MNVNNNGGLRSATDGEQNPHVSRTAQRALLVSPVLRRSEPYEAATVQELNDMAVATSANNVRGYEKTLADRVADLKHFQGVVQKTHTKLAAEKTNIVNLQEGLRQKDAALVQLNQQAANLTHEIDHDKAKVEEAKERVNTFITTINLNVASANTAASAADEARTGLEYAKSSHENMLYTAVKQQMNLKPNWKSAPVEMLDKEAVQYLANEPGFVPLTTMTDEKSVKLQKTESLYRLWDYMQEEGFGENPFCPSSVKDSRGGSYGNRLRGIRGKKSEQGSFLHCQRFFSRIEQGPVA